MLHAMIIKHIICIFFLILPNLLLGQKLEHNFKHSTCEKECSLDLNERIISKKITSDSIYVVFGIYHACCASFSSGATLSGMNLLLTYENIGDECFCTCFYELTYNIPTNGNRITEIRLNNQVLPETDNEFAIFNNTIDTLKNGTIVSKSYRNSELTQEIIHTDSVKTFRFYRKGKLSYERLIEKKGM